MGCCGIARVFLWWGKDNKAKRGYLVVQEVRLKGEERAQEEWQEYRVEKMYRIARVFLWWGKDSKAKRIRLVVFWWGRNGGEGCRSTASPQKDDDEITLAETLVNIKKSAIKDKGKSIMQESEPPKKIKKKEMIQISFDEEIAQRFYEEEKAQLLKDEEYAQQV
nr:hypothetical protein [Tanacetum cinerariifolium]